VAFDNGLPERVVERALDSLEVAGFDVTRYGYAPSEERKSLAEYERLLGAIAGSRHERNDPVIALGGGILGDLAGFAAATYRRGVPIVQCPTTLLSMVDASVGGKTGVNLAAAGGLKKNLVGAFHQPRLVLADIEALSSLPDRAFRAGLAECVKHGMIAGDWADPGLLDWTAASLGAILNRDASALVTLVYRNVTLKAAVVGRDEREEAVWDLGRAVLNLGHTFAHAIETLPGVVPVGQNPPIQHGEAVALGLLAASRCAAHMGLCGPEVERQTRDILDRAALPTVAGLPPVRDIAAAMAHDKKSTGGHLRVVLPTGPGRVRVVADPPEAAIASGLGAIRA